MAQFSPWIQLGSFGLLAFVVYMFTTKVIPAALKEMKDSRDQFVNALKEQRGEFREERRDERKFLEGENNLNRNAIGGLARAVEEGTVAIIANAKGVDVEEALQTYKKRNGTERSGATYS